MWRSIGMNPAWRCRYLNWRKLTCMQIVRDEIVRVIYCVRGRLRYYIKNSTRYFRLVQTLLLQGSQSQRSHSTVCFCTQDPITNVPLIICCAFVTLGCPLSHAIDTNNSIVFFFRYKTNKASILSLLLYDVVKQFSTNFFYEFKLNQSAAETAQKINQAFGNDSVNERTVH